MNDRMCQSDTSEKLRDSFSRRSHGTAKESSDGRTYLRRAKGAGLDLTYPAAALSRATAASRPISGSSAAMSGP